MKITYKGDYALKAILHLALKNDKVVTIHELAGHCDVPVKFLEQILLDLKRAGFVRSRRGKVGGYVLARMPGQIRLGDVIRYIEGPVGPIACTDTKYKGCKDTYKCIFRKVWQDVEKVTVDIVDRITFEDLVKQVKGRQGAGFYHI